MSNPFDGFEPWRNYQGSEPDLAVAWSDGATGADGGEWTLWDTENDGMFLVTPGGQEHGTFTAGGLIVYENDSPEGTDR